MHTVDQDATWYGNRPRPRRLCVTWGPRSPPKKGSGAPPANFLPMFIVAKRLDGSRWYLAVGIEVGLSRGECVRWGPSLPPQKGAEPPPQKKIGPCLLWPNGCIWIKMALGMDVGLCPGDFVLDGAGTCSSPYPKRGSPLPNFRPISIVAKRLDASRCYAMVWR